MVLIPLLANANGCTRTHQTRSSMYVQTADVMFSKASSSAAREREEKRWKQEVRFGIIG